MEIHRAGPEERTTIARVLATAFAEDPVHRWLVSNRRHDVRFFRTLTSHLHAAPDGADLALDAGVPVGAALWDPPGHAAGARQMLGTMAGLLAATGTRIGRAVQLEGAFERARPSGTFWYLALLGATTPGHGTGSALLEHRLAVIDGPVYLESSNERNISIYERHGFEVTAEIALAHHGPTVWAMLRR